MDMDVANVVLLANLLDEDDDEEEQLAMAMAEVAIVEMFDLEEGLGYIAAVPWVTITVNIEEFHAMGDPTFNMHFRMSRGVFEALSTAVENNLIERGRLRRRRRPFQDIMLMVVWLLANPDTFRSVAIQFGVRPSTLYYFYTYVIEALTEMSPQYISWPNAEERIVIKQAFQRISGFPGIVGCIDGTHVNITAPVLDAAAYVNRHHTYSMNVQAVVDHNLLVRELHVGEVGSMHDMRVFRRSQLYDDILNSAPGEILDVDEHLVGDGAYTLTDFMMIPFANNGHLTERQRGFNRALSQCRVRVENAFGRGKGKWRRIKHLHARNQQNVVDHITASFVLHNFIILNGDPILEENELERPINNNQILGNGEFQEEEDDPEPDRRAELIQAAEGRGIEKQLHIMNEILPNL